MTRSESKHIQAASPLVVGVVASRRRARGVRAALPDGLDPHLLQRVRRALQHPEMFFARQRSAFEPTRHMTSQGLSKVFSRQAWHPTPLPRLQVDVVQQHGTRRREAELELPAAADARVPVTKSSLAVLEIAAEDVRVRAHSDVNAGGGCGRREAEVVAGEGSAGDPEGLGGEGLLGGVIIQAGDERDRARGAGRQTREYKAVVILATLCSKEAEVSEPQMKSSGGNSAAAHRTPCRRFPARGSTGRRCPGQSVPASGTPRREKAPGLPPW